MPLLGVVAVAWLFLGGGMDMLTARGLKNNSQTVATNAVAEYEMAMRNGDTTSACFKAGMAASAYLSAQKEADYKRWKSIHTECEAKRL